MASSFDYTDWSNSELQRAELTARQFFSENHGQIFQAFESQCSILERLVVVLNRPDLTLDQRLDCFARIGEVSQSIRESAEGFFQLGSHPLIARVLANGERP